MLKLRCALRQRLIASFDWVSVVCNAAHATTCPWQSLNGIFGLTQLRNHPLNAQDTKVSSKNAKHSTAAACPCCAPAKGVASTSSQKCNLPSLRRERDDKNDKTCGSYHATSRFWAYAGTVEVLQDAEKKA